MTTYTVEIQASNADRTIWQAVAPAETVETDDTAAELAADTAANQNIAEGSDWRVRVWEGDGADTATEPTAEHVAGTTINDLAQTIRDEHGIDTFTAARDAVTAHADQISDDADLWDNVTNTLTPAGVEMVTGAIAATYSVGAVATRAAQILVDLENVVAEIGKLTARRDDLIRAALKTELRRADIAAAAQLNESRLYQIRDGRR